MNKEYNLYIEFNDNIIEINNINSEKEAIKIGKEKIRVYDIRDQYYEFSITEIPDRIISVKEYYTKLSKELNKEELYDLLLSLAEGKKSYYDYNGNLLSIEKLKMDHFNSFSFKSLLGCHSDKFNVGDKIRFRYANNKCEGIIIGKYEKDCKSIYSSDDPYRFKEGYNVEYTIDGYTTYNENWEEPYYDEDLELVKDE